MSLVPETMEGKTRRQQHPEKIVPGAGPAIGGLSDSEKKTIEFGLVRPPVALFHEALLIG